MAEICSCTTFGTCTACAPQRERELARHRIPKKEKVSAQWVVADYLRRRYSAQDRTADESAAEILFALQVTGFDVEAASV